MQDTPLNFFKDKRYEYLTEIADEDELKAFRFWDFKSDENFLIRNAALTAEGVLKIIIEELPISLEDTNVAITGCGRVGKKTSELLQKVNCKVSVFDRTKSKDPESGCYGFHDFTRLAENFDCVVNTVPEMILTREMLCSLRPECLLIETASAPYGIDFEAADDMGIKAIIAGGLPGKISPKSAAKIILESLKKEGKND